MPAIAVEFVNFEPLPTGGKLAACFADTVVSRRQLASTLAGMFPMQWMHSSTEFDSD